MRRESEMMREVWNLRLRVMLAFTMALALLAASCGGDDSSDGGGGESGPVTIGFATARTGLLQPFDVPPTRAAKLAIEDLNEAGGIDGRRIEVIERDTKSDPAQGANAAIEMIDEGANLIVTSCDLDFGGPAAAEAQKANLIGFSTCAASSDFGPSGIGPLAFTMSTAARGISSIMAEWAYKDRGLRRGFLLQDSTIAYSKEVGEGFKLRWEALGGELAGEETFENDDESIASQVNEIRSTRPEFVYIASYQPGIVSALRQIRSGGVDVPVLSAGDLDGDYWKEAVPNVSDVYYAYYGSIYGDDPDPRVNQFINRYTRQFGVPETASLLTGYSVIEAFARAAEKAGSTEGDTVAAALESFDDERLLVGPTTFTKELHINPRREARIMEIKNGKTKFLTLWEPEEVPDVGG